MVNDTASAKGTAVVLRGRRVTYADVLHSIKECDRVGKDKFLLLHGYAESVRYHLRHSGRSYPSKAILGVAAGLDAADFFGGAGETVTMLNHLGFHVRNSETGEIVDSLGIELLRRRAVAAGFDDPCPDWAELPVTPSSYFLSGSNCTPEIEGLGKLGIDIGVAAHKVSRPGVAALKALRGSDVLVFIDSGAFSEVDKDTLQVVAPITDAEWRKRLGLYKAVATSLGSQAYVVAPDQIGSQEATLTRLATYKQQVLDLIATGARVLVVMQKGAMTQYEFSLAVDKVLGTTTWVPALPCKKAATTPNEVRQFLIQRNPAHCHLLGLGVGNAKINQYLGNFVGRPTSVSLDSCWITANVGKPVDKNGNIRMARFTKAQAYATMVGAHGDLKKQVALALCLGAPVPEQDLN